MNSGRQWIALDADYYSAPFIQALHQRFGPVGVGVFTAFLCACKRNHPQGELSYSSEAEALAKMGIEAWALVDSDGKPWALVDLWKFSGRMKQTRRKPGRRSSVLAGTRENVRATHWERWQKATRMDEEQARKRMWGEQKRSAETARAGRGNGRRGATDSDSRQPPYPPGGEWATPPAGNGQSEDLKELKQVGPALAAAVRHATGLRRAGSADD